MKFVPNYTNAKQMEVTVHQTSDWHLFEFMPENRATTRGHIDRQKRSLQTYGWLKDNPMQVVRGKHGTWRIVDGQHRFLAARELKIPVIFIEKNDEDYCQSIQIQHTFMKSWTLPDYLRHWSKRGVEDYQYVANFAERNELPIAAAIAALNGEVKGLKTNTALGDRISGNTTLREVFKEGNWRIPPLRREIAETIVSRVNEIRNYHRFITPLKNESRFIGALFILASHPEYDHKRMMKQIAGNVMVITKCPTAQLYIELFLRIYNKQYGINNRLVIDPPSKQAAKVPSNRSDDYEMEEMR